MRSTGTAVLRAKAERAGDAERAQRAEIAERAGGAQKARRAGRARIRGTLGIAGVILIFLIAFVAIPAFGKSTQASPPDSLWAVGDEVIEALTDGELATVVEMLHYPASYSKEELAADTAAIRVALDLLFAKLGTPEGFKRFSGESRCYDIGLSGGDPSYWESLSPLKTVDLVYAGKFTKFGKGFMNVSFFETKSGVDIRALVVRLDASVPRARETVIDVYVALAEAQAAATGMTLPENLRELISASVPDLTAIEKTPEK